MSSTDFRPIFSVPEYDEATLFSHPDVYAVVAEVAG